MISGAINFDQNSTKNCTGTEGENTNRTEIEITRVSYNDTDDSASYPVVKRGVLPEHSKRERNAGLKSSEPAGRTKGIVIPVRQSPYPVSCERNKIV